MFSDLDVFITNYTIIDPEIFQLWIEGYSSSEAVSQTKSTINKSATPVSLELIASDVLDHYRTYSLLEKLMYSPIKLNDQPAFQLEPQTKRLLIEKYYSLDDSVCRELLGKKLSTKHRKDLDEIADKTCVKIKSCRRQFDNIKRIFKIVEELSGNIVNNIKAQFLLSEELAKKYAAIVFIACIRFETSKKKLLYLNFADFFECAMVLQSFWTYTYHSGDADYFDTEMDKEFLLDLRELRCLLEKEKEIKHLLSIRLKPTLLEKAYQELDVNFKLYWRAIIGIAINLHRSRELRFFFLEIIEKLIEPWKQNNWTGEQVQTFLTSLTQSVLDLEVPARGDQELGSHCLWDRYMQVLNVCLVKMYHN